MAKFNYRTTPAEPKVSTSPWADRPEVPYLLPFFAFLLVMVPGQFADAGGPAGEQLWQRLFPAAYALKTVLAAFLFWYFWPCYTRVRWERLGWGVLVGTVGTLVWIGAEYACQHLGIASPKDPAAKLFLF